MFPSDDVIMVIFSESYTEVANNPEVVAHMKWMSMIAMIKFRMLRLMQRLIGRLKRNYFTYEDGRYLLKIFVYDVNNIELNTLETFVVAMAILN